LPPPLPPVGDLDDREKRALMILYTEYPAPVALRQLAGMIGHSYGKGEQLFQKLEGLQLVDVVKNPYHGTQVVLTERGRDLCIERGIAHR
jgi:DNA-binding MarR family transcriptional regulator